VPDPEPGADVVRVTRANIFVDQGAGRVTRASLTMTA
jgi:hypothetical protein